MRRFALIFSFLVLAALDARSEPGMTETAEPGLVPRFVNYSAADGLPSNTVYAIAQDADGVRALAVMLPQTSSVNDFPVHGIVTIEELEAATGLRFFPDMPKFLARPLKADRPTRLWPIRFVDIVKLILLRFT